MGKGLFSSLKEDGSDNGLDKKWRIELQRYHKYWYDLIVYPNEVAEYFDSRKLIVDYLKRVKKEVEEKFNKRFVYFICSRTKVRFNTNKKPSYNPVTQQVEIHLLVDKEEKSQSIMCQFIDRGLNKPFNPKIVLTDKYITLTDSKGHLTTVSVHDFLESSDINLGMSSNVEYVGYTENPHKRPTNGSHTGLSDTLYKIADKNLDTLIYFNVFRVATEITSNDPTTNFTIANLNASEIDPNLEGKIIEKCFIFYFDAINQNRNKGNELPELENDLNKIARENKINSLAFYYEFERPNDYATFSSSKVEPSISHKFSVKLVDGKVEIARGN